MKMAYRVRLPDSPPKFRISSAKIIHLTFNQNRKNYPVIFRVSSAYLNPSSEMRFESSFISVMVAQPPIKVTLLYILLVYAMACIRDFESRLEGSIPSRGAKIIDF